MIVVSNTSPITNLAAVGQLAVLQQLYEKDELELAVAELNQPTEDWHPPVGVILVIAQAGSEKQGEYKIRLYAWYQVSFD